MKRMISIIERHQHRYDAQELFTRFLEYVIVGFDHTFSPIEKPFDKNEVPILQELFNAWILAMNDALNQHDWYDILGEMYMTYISGKGKKQCTGQFFTPMSVCDLMARIIDHGEHTGESVLDNACGSGRMLLATNSVHSGNYCCAQDMDRLCCLMTVCNFIIHGINGEVVWGNSLDPSDYCEGWRTNEMLNVIGIPCCRKMDMMESKIFRRNLRYLSDRKENNNDDGSTVLQEKAVVQTSPQLNLFYFDDDNEAIYNR